MIPLQKMALPGHDALVKGQGQTHRPEITLLPGKSLFWLAARFAFECLFLRVYICVFITIVNPRPAGSVHIRFQSKKYLTLIP